MSLSPYENIFKMSLSFMRKENAYAEKNKTGHRGNILISVNLRINARFFLLVGASFARDIRRTGREHSSLLQKKIFAKRINARFFLLVGASFARDIRRTVASHSSLLQKKIFAKLTHRVIRGGFWFDSAQKALSTHNSVLLRLLVPLFL